MPARFDVLAELHPPQKWDRPVCLLVDEIQTVAKEHGKCLKELHLGEHGLPIMTVCAGLSVSAEKLRRAISPRLTSGNMRTLGVLPPEEVQSCVRQMLARCRVNYTAEQLKQFGGGIADRSEGWPQHVRTGTAALFGELAETRGDLERVDPEAVERRADTYREASYLERQSKEFGDSCDLVADLLRAMPETGMKRNQAVDITREKEVSYGPESWRLPKGMDAGDFLDHLIHQGIFQPDERNILSCPIPSFWSWLIRHGTENQEELARMSGQAARRTLGSAAEQAEPERERPGDRNQDRGEWR